MNQAILKAVTVFVAAFFHVAELRQTVCGL